MRVGLISDTHVPHVAKELPPAVLDLFAGVNLILHAGDIYSATVLDALERIAPVYAALGDDDYVKRDRRVMERHVLELAGQTVLLTHVGPFRFSAGEWLPRGGWLEEADSVPAPQIVVFGHEHRAFLWRENGTLYVNPGSPSLQNDHGSPYKPYRRGPGSVALLEVGDGGAEARILAL